MSGGAIGQLVEFIRELIFANFTLGRCPVPGDAEGPAPARQGHSQVHARHLLDYKPKRGGLYLTPALDRCRNSV
jgi:hypothetical protein